MNEVIRYASHVAITNYTPGDCPGLEHLLSYKEQWKTVFIGTVYDDNKKELLIFGGIDDWILKAKTGKDVIEDYNYDEAIKSSIRLRKTSLKSKLQSEMIRFLTAGKNYEQNYNHSQLSCNADTGEGKTFCAVTAITQYRTRTMIILNRVNILNQWRDELLKFTDVDYMKVITLDTETIVEIYNGKHTRRRWDIFLVGHRTLANAAKLIGWEGIGEVFRKLGIGLKIYDEAHREFANTALVDCYTNTKKTIYLTATPKLSGPKANYIYQTLFRGMPKFNQRELGFNESKKHIQMIAVIYNSQPSSEAKHRCKTIRGFNSKEHSIYQINSDNKFEEILMGLIDKMAIKNGFRSLIYVSRIVACDTIVKWIKTEYPDISVSAYHSEIPKADKEDIINNSQIIVSTNQSLGLGENIPNLQWVCNCEAFSTDTIGIQASGRLRRLEDKKCFYTELLDFGFKSIRKQWASRRKLYSDIFNNVLQIDLMNKSY